MPKEPVTTAAASASSEASIGEDSMMAEARQIIAEHDQSGANGSASNTGSSPGDEKKKKKPQAANRQPPKPEANFGNDDAAAKNVISELGNLFADQSPQRHAQRNKNDNKKNKGSPASTSPKMASPLLVQSARSPLSSPDSQRSQRQMGPTKATSPLSVQSAQSPLSSPDSQRSHRQVVANPSADSHDRSIGAVSTLSAVSAGARSVRSSQSQRSIKQSHSTQSGQSKVPAIDLNADDGSKMTTDTRQLNDKLRSSVDKERKSSRKLENIVGVLGEDDPLSQAIRKVEDDDNTMSGTGTEASVPIPPVIASSADALNGSSKGTTASDIVAAIASATEDLDVRTSPSGNQSIGDTPRDSGNRSVASVAAHTTASAASRRSDAIAAATAPPTLPPTMSTPYSFTNKDIIQDNIENGGHSANTNGEARAAFDNEPKPIYGNERTFVQRNRKALLLGFGLVAIVAAIAGIGVAASSKRSNASDADSFMGTPAPTPFLTLESLLSTWSPDGGVAMKTLPFSPQGIAYAWIKADLQTLGYDPDDLSGYDDSVAAFESRRMADRVKTRYALSVLNYTFWGGSGAGVSTDTFDAWSHENDECNFAQVSCEYDGEGFGDGLVRVLDFDEADIPEGSVLPGEVTMLSDLNALIFTSTRLGGKIPDVFSPMQDLRVLDLDDCVFTGSVPESIANLVNLEELRLNDNILEGPLPDLFWNLKFLRVLEMQKNLFTGTISQSIWSLGPSLEDLRIGDNELSGTLSTQIGKLRNLERFWAYTNQLTGKIPTQIGKLTFLNDLAMDDNRFVGAIPKQLASCPLTELWLNSNRLSSSIPASLGEILGLENLYLDENLLTGTVPLQLGNLYNCTDLFLNNNKLSGKVPATLGYMESLQRLRLHANSLTGAVPPALCAFGLDQLTADCADLPQLGVLISCPTGCCTECY